MGQGRIRIVIDGQTRVVAWSRPTPPTQKDVEALEALERTRMRAESPSLEARAKLAEQRKDKEQPMSAASFSAHQIVKDVQPPTDEEQEKESRLEYQSRKITGKEKARKRAEEGVYRGAQKVVGGIPVAAMMGVSAAGQAISGRKPQLIDAKDAERLSEAVGTWAGVPGSTEELGLNMALTAVAPVLGPMLARGAKKVAEPLFKRLADEKALSKGVGGMKRLPPTPDETRGAAGVDFVPREPNVSYRKPAERPVSGQIAPETTAVGKKEGRAVADEPVKAVEEPKATGISHAEMDGLRHDLGWSPRAKDAKPDEQLATDAQKYAGKERTVADRIVSDEKASLSDEESVALGLRLRTLKGEMVEAKGKGDESAFDLADEEAQRIADALDASGTRQGRAFRARRFLFDVQEDSWTLNRRARKANLDEPLPPKKQAQLDTAIKELEAANAILQKERDAAVSGLEMFKSARLSKRSKGPLTPERRRSEALSTLKRLGVPVADAKEAVAGGIKGKQAGAINIPVAQTEEVARAVRSLVRSYADDGIGDWNGLMQRMGQDLPGIGEEQALWILSGKYKTAKLEADLAKRKTNNFLRDVQRDAEYRTKPLASKALQLGLDVLGTTQRTLQTTLDNSLSLIQGKNVLMWKPGTWFKAVGHSLKAGLRADPISYARKLQVEMENDPLYSRAVQAKLGLSDIDGPFNKQEEFFAGSIESKIPGIANSKAMATVLANKMRMDLFRKLAKVNPNDADYLRDIAQQINIVTGKGEGRVAELLGSRPAGLVSYAPRYYLSTWQHNLGVPLWSAKTKQGRIQALKMYGTQLAFYGAALKAAELFGFEVDTDPRSTSFGVAKSADGSYSFDLFRKQAEPVRVMAQLIYGRVARKGKHTPPDAYNAYTVGDYIESKASPIMRTGKMVATGKTYDDREGGFRDARPSDFWESYIPLSIREMLKMKDKPGTYPASFFGAGIDKPAPQESTAPPLKAWPPPGLQRISGGAKNPKTAGS